MVQGCQSCIPSLAAGPLSAARSAALTPTWVISPAETRIGGRRCGASGRLSRRGRRRREIATGSRGCRYKTASGRRKWPNRDPIGESGFELIRRKKPFKNDYPNLYIFVANDPMSRLDPLGLDWFDRYTECLDMMKWDLVCGIGTALGLPGSVRGPGIVPIVCRKITAGTAGWCAGVSYGCMIDAMLWTPWPPSSPPYPIAPPGSGCSTCPVNGPPVMRF